MEHNENATFDDDFGGRLSYDLDCFWYTGETDCTNDRKKKVWVEDGGSCSLGLDHATSNTAIFSCKGGEAANCDFTLTTAISGHWKGNYEGIDAQLTADGSFVSIDMSGKVHLVQLTFESGKGRTTITDSITFTGSAGVSSTSKVSAGGTFSGIDVGLVSGKTLTGAVSGVRTIEKVTNTTGAALWDVAHMVHSNFRINVAKGEVIPKVRFHSWSWIQQYTEFTGDDAVIRRGNTSKIEWLQRLLTYSIDPHGV